MSAVRKEAIVEPKRSARQVAADCYRACGGNEQAAQIMLRELILSDPPLREEVLAPFLATVTRDLIRDCRNLIRSTIATPAARGSMGLKELARTWYDWPLSDGTLLGDASADQLLTEGDRYERLASVHKRRSQFFANLARLMPKNGKKVREAISNDEIKKIASKCGLDRGAV